MASDREKTAGFVILAKCFVETVPYDARGAFVLLNSFSAEMGSGMARSVEAAAHLHVLAGLSDDKGAQENARQAMDRLIDVFERRLAQGPTA